MPSTTETSSPSGLPLERLRNWLDDAHPEGCGELRARPITGGRSNLTFVVDDGEHTWVVRRPPIGEHLATAHDVAREHRVLAALSTTDVPVPGVLGLCEQQDVIGAPFFVMEYVEGATYRNAGDLTNIGPDRTRVLAERLVDTLATVHAVDLEATGLSGWGHPEGFLARQVRRWRAQLEATRTPHLDLVAALGDRLAAAVPSTGHVGLIHGDFRLDNVLVGGNDAVLAVIDWELSTVGDTMTDVALAVVYQRLAARVQGDLVPTASVAAGYLDEHEVLARYGEVAPHGLEYVDFHLALASYKIAGIVAGIDDRYRKGQVAGAGVDRVGSVVRPLLASGLDLL